jgi:hypothetical protein
VAAPCEVADQAGDLSLTAAESGLRVDVQYLQTAPL